MNKIITVSLLLTFLTIKAAAQDNSTVSAQIVPENFKSDGCSMFPDGDYRDCCVEHDLAYFKGGTGRERFRADNKLFGCVANKKGWWHKIIAPVMWAGVRVGGVSFLPTSFRWGFGRKKQQSLLCKKKLDAR